MKKFFITLLFAVLCPLLFAAQQGGSLYNMFYYVNTLSDFQATVTFFERKFDNDQYLLGAGIYKDKLISILLNTKDENGQTPVTAQKNPALAAMMRKFYPSSSYSVKDIIIFGYKLELQELDKRDLRFKDSDGRNLFFFVRNETDAKVLYHSFVKQEEEVAKAKNDGKELTKAQKKEMWRGIRDFILSKDNSKTDVLNYHSAHKAAGLHDFLSTKVLDINAKWSLEAKQKKVRSIFELTPEKFLE